MAAGLALFDLVFVGFEHIFANAAFRADKVFRQIFERDVVVLSRIVNPATRDALPFLHDFLP